jgi:hypothetical protein
MLDIVRSLLGALRATVRTHRALALENPWGTPRIDSELRKFGIKVSPTTVAKYRTQDANAIQGKSADLATCQTSFQGTLAMIADRATAAGIACRFHDNGDNTVTDLDTGLMWLKLVGLDGVPRQTSSTPTTNGTGGRPSGWRRDQRPEHALRPCSRSPAPRPTVTGGCRRSSSRWRSWIPTRLTADAGERASIRSSGRRLPGLLGGHDLRHPRVGRVVRGSCSGGDRVADDRATDHEGSDPLPRR